MDFEKVATNNNANALKFIEIPQFVGEKRL